MMEAAARIVRRSQGLAFADEVFPALLARWGDESAMK